MEDFNEYAQRVEDTAKEDTQTENLFNLVSSIATKYNGKSQNELLMAIYKEAEKGKRNGTLSNADIDNFAQTISPFLDDKKKRMLNKIVDELKKI